jgi:hypothetical protein
MKSRVKNGVHAMKASETSWALVLLLMSVLPVTGQQNNPPPVKGMASTVGLYVYPEKKQSATQQLTDESQCYDNAKTQTGFNPDATTTGSKAQAQSNTKDHGAAKGAARGAVISGATGGDPAAGAERGAILGGVRSRRKDKQQEEQNQTQADANKTQEQQNMDNFKRSMSACLDARGYSVR